MTMRDARRHHPTGCLTSACGRVHVEEYGEASEEMPTKHVFRFEKATHKLAYTGRELRESAVLGPPVEREVIIMMFNDFKRRFTCSHVFCKDCAVEHENHFLSGHSPHIMESQSDSAVKGEPTLFLVRACKEGNSWPTDWSDSSWA